jgi:sulfonate dioxygenase
VEDLGEFDHFDPGHRADPSLPNLLKNATKSVRRFLRLGWKLTDITCGSSTSRLTLAQSESAYTTLL